MHPDLLAFSHRREIAEFGVKNKMPVAAAHGFAESDCLMSFDAHWPDLFRRAASYVDKILKGAKPADLPIEQPTTFRLIINLKTAKALGLTIPRSLLQQAKIWEAVDYVPKVDDFEQYLLTREAGAEAALNAHLTLRVVFQDTYNSKPAPGKVPSDLAIVSSLVWIY